MPITYQHITMNPRLIQQSKLKKRSTKKPDSVKSLRDASASDKHQDNNFGLVFSDNHNNHKEKIYDQNNLPKKREGKSKVSEGKIVVPENNSHKSQKMKAGSSNQLGHKNEDAKVMKVNKELLKEAELKDKDLKVKEQKSDKELVQQVDGDKKSKQLNKDTVVQKGADSKLSEQKSMKQKEVEPKRHELKSNKHSSVEKEKVQPVKFKAENPDTVKRNNISAHNESGFFPHQKGMWFL